MATDQLAAKPTVLVVRSQSSALREDVCAWGQHATVVWLESVTSSSPQGGQPETYFSRPANNFLFTKFPVLNTFCLKYIILFLLPAYEVQQADICT